MPTSQIPEGRVITAIEKQLSLYPESRLTDLYKSCFQDRFGPGHIVANPTAAAAYLEQELADMQPSAMPPLEPTGWQNRYVRVNLELIKNGTLPKGVLLAAFIESANGATPPSTDTWRGEWQQIVAVIQRGATRLPDYDSDFSYIENRLKTGVCDMHHSEPFRQAYRPHYRIVSSEIFEEKVRPLIKIL